MELPVPISAVGRRGDEFYSAFLVLRWQRTVLVNLICSAAALGIGDIIRIVLAAGFVTAYYFNILHDLCKGYAPYMKGAGSGPILAGIGLAAAIGIQSAFPLAGFALRLAFSTWLAGLPISIGQRLRAASVFGGVLGAVTAVPVAVSGWLATGWLGLPSPGAGGALVTAAYLGGFGLMLMLRVSWRWMVQRRRKSSYRPVPRLPMSWSVAGEGSRSFPFARFDQNRPRWLGHWVTAWATDPALTPGLIAVVLANAVGITACIVQRTDFPVLVFIVLTAHLVYLHTLRLNPLASPVLRAAPLGFLTAFIGAVRLPLVVSLAAVTPLVVTALMVAPGSVVRTLGCLLIVLLLAVQYAALAATMPAARGVAILVHAVILGIAANEIILYQYVVPLALAGFTLMMWFRAKRRYEG